MSTRTGLALGSLSFANLCALNLWHDTQRLEAPSINYFRAGPAGHTLLFASLLSVLGLAALFYAAGFLAGRCRRQAARRCLHLGFILAFLLPVRLLHYVVVWSDLPATAQTLATMFLFVCYGGIVGAAVWYWFARDETPLAALTRLNLALLPLLPIVLAGHLLYLHRGAPSPGEFEARRVARAADEHPAGAQRVLWIVFDEFDFNVAFSRRPKSVALPELDRLRGESIFATEAYPPFGETLASMPALVNGRTYQGARVTGVNSLEIRDSDGRVHLWKSSDTVFARLRAAGLRAGVVGWYHPYCRIFGEVLEECTFVPATKFALLVREAYARDLGVPTTAVYLLLQQLRFLPLGPGTISPSLDEIARSGQIEEYGRVHREALKQLANLNLDVVMLHYPIPHPYGIYSRTSQVLTLSASASYLDNLALADRVVGELRAALEGSGLADRTAIILSSDHSLRDEREAILPGTGRPPGTRPSRGMGRIPFLVMIPGDPMGRDYTRHLDSVVTSRLVSALAEGRLRTLDQVEAWLGCGGE
jgi:hypothetical protein